MDFTGKVVLITGSSRGIGRAIAQLFARHGRKKSRTPFYAWHPRGRTS